MQSISDKNYREAQKTCFMFNNFFSENRTLYKIIWENVVEPESQQITI